MHKIEFTLSLENEAETLALGARLASVLTAGLTVWLCGDLGAGKTTLARGLMNGLGFTGKVKSPTYALVEPYVVSGLHLYHFDLYRIVDQEEWNAAGFREYFSSSTVCLVEWPEKAADLLPVPDIQISLAVSGCGRTAHLSSYGEKGFLCLERLPP